MGCRSAFHRFTFSSLNELEKIFLTPTKSVYERVDKLFFEDDKKSFFIYLIYVFFHRVNNAKRIKNCFKLFRLCKVFVQQNEVNDEVSREYLKINQLLFSTRHSLAQHEN